MPKIPMAQKKYKPNVLTPPDASAKAVFETGNVVGELACQYFADNFTLWLRLQKSGVYLC